MSWGVVGRALFGAALVCFPYAVAQLTHTHTHTPSTWHVYISIIFPLEMKIHARTNTHRQRRKYVKNVWASWFHLFTSPAPSSSNMGATDAATIPNNLTWFNSKNARLCMQTCTCSQSGERARAQWADSARKKCRLPVVACRLLLSALITKLARALTHILSRRHSLRACVCVHVRSRQIVLVASKLIRSHQSALKRDGVHLVEPSGAVFSNSRECLLVVRVCVCARVSAKWFLPFKLITINLLLSNELVSARCAQLRRTNHPQPSPQLGNE